jgi:hypothetical protein
VVHFILRLLSSFFLECFKLLELDRECGKSLELSNSSPTHRLTAEVYKTLFLRDADAGQVLDIRLRKIVIFKLMVELNRARNVAHSTCWSDHVLLQQSHCNRFFYYRFSPQANTLRRFFISFLSQSEFFYQLIVNGRGVLLHLVTHNDLYTTGRTPPRQRSGLSQRPLPDNTQNLKETDSQTPGRIRTRNPSKREAADPRFRDRGQLD